MPHSTGRAFNHPLPSTSLPLSLSLLLPPSPSHHTPRPLTTLPVLSPHSPSSHHTPRPLTTLPVLSPHSPSSHHTPRPLTTPPSSHHTPRPLTTLPVLSPHSPSSHHTPVLSPHSPSSHHTPRPLTTLPVLSPHSPSSHHTPRPLTTLPVLSPHSPSSHHTPRPLTTLPVLSPHSPSSHHTHPPLRLISYSSSRDEDAINRRSQSFGDSLPSWLRWKSWTTHIKGGKRSRSWLNSSMSVKWVICDLRAKSWGGREGGRAALHQWLITTTNQRIYLRWTIQETAHCIHPQVVPWSMH